jgi:HlyD family secretion protein
VKAGQLLATLDRTYSDADLKQLAAKINGLNARIARLEAENKNTEFDVSQHSDDRDWMMQHKVYVQRKIEFEAKIREFSAQENRLLVQQESNDVALELDRESYKIYLEYQSTIADLAKRGSKSGEDMISRQLQTGQAKKTYYQTKSRQNELVKEIEAAITQRDAYIASWNAETMTNLVESVSERTATDQEYNKAVRTNEQVELRVPTDRENDEYFVFEVADVSVGSVARPGDPLFRLIPLDVPYEAEVEISGRDIAMIREGTAEQSESEKLPQGSSVRVKLDSFPYQKHGTINGVVRKISEGSFEKQGPGGQPTGQTTYKARVQLLNPDELDNVSDNFRLMPGMTATAEIKVGKRRVIQYFLYPLIRYMDEWGREP